MTSDFGSQIGEICAKEKKRDEYYNRFYNGVTQSDAIYGKIDEYNYGNQANDSDGTDSIGDEVIVVRRLIWNESYHEDMTSGTGDGYATIVWGDKDYHSMVVIFSMQKE